MRVICAAAVIAIVAGPAYGQSKVPTTLEEMMGSHKTPDQIEKEQAADKAYKESLKKIPDAKPADPWGNARGADAPKTVAKAPSAKKPAAKTGSAAPQP
jgi:hypothetical protein